MRSWLIGGPVPLVGILAIASSCGGNVPEAEAPPPIDPVFWANIQCDSLDGLAFKITHYRDNQPQNTDVIRFHDGKVESDQALAMGMNAGELGCQLQAPGELIFKANMIDGNDGYWQWVGTVKQGHIDGMVTRGRKDAGNEPYTFAGDLAR